MSRTFRARGSVRLGFALPRRAACFFLPLSNPFCSASYYIKAAGLRDVFCERFDEKGMFFA